MTPTLAKIVAFGLFLAMGFAAVPLMLRLFVYGQRRIGNGAVPMVRFLADHQTGVVLAVWAVFALGLTIALPAMITDEFFGRPAKLAADQVALARRLIDEGTAAGEVARMFKVHRATLYRALGAAPPVRAGTLPPTPV